MVNIQEFAAGKFDITRGQWAVFVSDTNRPTNGGCSWSGLPSAPDGKPWDPHPDASWKNLGFVQDDSHPVVCVTWNDAQDYVKWLSAKAGANYRLLTEAEWEYAARAGTSTAYPWGSSASHEYANYGTDTVAGVGFASGRDKWLFTSPVGSFPPNQFGLYDLHGMYYRGSQDCFSASYSDCRPRNCIQTEIELEMLPDRFFNEWKSSCSFRICAAGMLGIIRY